MGEKFSWTEVMRYHRMVHLDTKKKTLEIKAVEYPGGRYPHGKKSLNSGNKKAFYARIIFPRANMSQAQGPGWLGF